MQQVPALSHPAERMEKNKKILAIVLAALADVDSDHVLVGGLLTGLYGKERGTVDVDMLVPKRVAKPLTEALQRRGYIVKAHKDMLRVYERGNSQSVVDFVWREGNATLLAASAATTKATVLGLPVTVVKRGAYAALKFHASISPTRKYDDKIQDAADLVRTVRRRFSATDQALAVSISSTIYPGAEKELLSLIDDIKSGRPIKV